MGEENENPNVTTAVAVKKERTNLANLPETDPTAVIDSPRSLRACAQEGVAPSDLVFKTVDAFREKGLEARLVKLRYDFFEAKRKDLLAACKKARDVLVEAEEKERNATGTTLDELARKHGVSTGVLLAINGDTVKQERQRMAQAQHLQHKWLENQLANQLHTIKMLESADKFMAEAEADDSAEQKAHADRMKAKNDERRRQEEEKAAEFAAQQRLERQIAKEEFERQQEELEEMKRQQERARQEQHARSMRDQERKAQAERDKERRREEAWQAQKRAMDNLQANDDRRTEIMGLQKKRDDDEMRARRKFRDDRIALSMSNLGNKQQEKLDAYNAKKAHEDARNQKLENLRLLQKEEGSKRSMQLAMKRQSIMDEANRKAEDRRNSILAHQQEIEHRMMMHEMKRERYMEFKGELDMLKDKNKEINVIRQRRKEDQRRAEVAEEVRRKDDKIEMLNHERQFLWNLRRTTGNEIQRAREEVKNNITSMKLKSTYNSATVAKQIQNIYGRKIFNVDMKTVKSMPSVG